MFAKHTGPSHTGVGVGDVGERPVIVSHRRRLVVDPPEVREDGEFGVHPRYISRTRASENTLMMIRARVLSLSAVSTQGLVRGAAERRGQPLQ